MDKFPDLLPFAFTIARLFVSEVRQRASNKHAENASLAILKFLDSKPLSQPSAPEPDETCTPNQLTHDPSEGVAQGWDLLLSLCTLSLSNNPQLIQLLCDASLPSTLIKCLYLFFDLPTQTTELVDNELNSQCNKEEARMRDNLAPRETHNELLMKVLTKLLVQLCSHQSAIDELIKKDDLRLLIGIASSQCSSHNKAWRRVAFKTLIAISRSMRDNFMYLEQNYCLQNYVENMHRINSLALVTLDELIDMIGTLFEFVYNLDVNNRINPQRIAPLLEQFKASRIVDLIEEVLFKIDESIVQENRSSSPGSHDSEFLNYTSSKQTSVSSETGSNIEEYRNHGRRLVQSLTIMAKINIDENSMAHLTTLKPIATTRFEMLEQFRMPRASARNCILNPDVLRLFKLAWSRCGDHHIVEAILDATISLFNDDKFNYFIFESQQLLVYYMTSNSIKLFPRKLKQKLLKFLEFIIIETHYIPCLELGTLGTMIKKNTSSDVDLTLGLRTVIACLRFNSKFSDIFREIGLLEVIIDLLINATQQEGFCQNGDRLEALYLLLESSQHLLAGPNNLNCTQFNESGAARHVFNCLSKPEYFHLFAARSSNNDEGWTTVSTSTGSSSPLSAHNKLQSSHLPNYHSRTSSQTKPSVKQLQKIAFTIIRQLILSTAGDEHLANLLGLLARNLDDLKSLENSNDVQGGDDTGAASGQPVMKFNFNFLLSHEVSLKICILKSLMIILKDSHRCRILFRKAGGFIYIVSTLETLEGSLPSPCESSESESYNRWKQINSRKIWRLIKNSFMTIIVAIRSEPANLRTFSDEVMPKFTEAIRRLGCFLPHQKCLPPDVPSGPADDLNSYRSIFLAPPTRDFSTIVDDILGPNRACCQLFRFLYDMSLDMGDGTAELEIQLEHQRHTARSHYPQDTKSISFDQSPSITQNLSRESGVFRKRSQMNMAPKRPPSLDLNSMSTNSALLTFPCIIISMLDLIPSCPSHNLMIFVCSVIRSLSKHGRNRQMLCEAGLISRLLNQNWRISITDKTHFLYETSEFMLQNLTQQAITARELRTILRLGDPLRCKNLDEIYIEEPFQETKQNLSEINSTPTPCDKNVEKIPSDRIETLVSMITDDTARAQPPFVEFDMSRDGLSSIFMPSIAPINAKSLPPNSSSFLNSTLDVHTSEKNGILGGVGSTERVFPPLTGLTYSTWICIDKLPSRSSDASHNLRLLTIYRGSASSGKEYSCFRIQISALDRALTVSTQETLLFDNNTRSDDRHDPDCNLRIWTPELIIEGKWHHIVVTMNRSLMKQSTIHVYIDGIMVHNQRISYISNYVGTANSGGLGNSNPGGNSISAAAFVNAFIGSLPQFRFQLITQWKQGPCHLIEEPLSANFVSLIYALGPTFIGNFQGSHRSNELGKFVTLLNQAHGELRSQQSESHHRPLVHQQSNVITGTAQHHNQQLTRVASSTTPSNVHHSSQSNCTCTISEDRILMSIDSRATSLMTLSRMRRIYTRFDCRQISRVLGLAIHENSTSILLLHNTGVHLNGPSRGLGAVTIGYSQVRCFVPSPTESTLFHLGGCYILLGLVAQSESTSSLSRSLYALVSAMKQNVYLQAQMDSINGYQTLSVFYWKKKHLLNPDILKLTLSLITETTKVYARRDEKLAREIQQATALRDLICECFDLWLKTGMINQVLEFIHDLINSSNTEQHSSQAPYLNGCRVRNLKCLRDMDLLPRILRLLPHYDARKADPRLRGIEVESSLDNSNQEEPTVVFDTKAVYLMRQIVFELLNRTPRQSDILYFGQFLASLLPFTRKERLPQIIDLRNLLLKSLIQMMTRNRQREVNDAMQEEIVRILGFDWFMLFINSSHLDRETISIGFLNLMVILSNSDLYGKFKSKSLTNGGWLKEPTFPTIDGKFNIQLLGINVGIFFGLNGKRKSIKHDLLDAPNFFLLRNCLSNLIELPKIYLMIFQTMMGRLSRLDTGILDSIETFGKLSLDSLCDSLVGDTHHKRRQTLSGIKFKCHELVVCLIYMIRDLICLYETEFEKSKTPANEGNDQHSREFPAELIRFLMYLYNNNEEFQNYCRNSDDIIDALAETLMTKDNSNQPDYESVSPLKESPRSMTQHPASKECLELCRLIILDRMTDPASSGDPNYDDQLHAFERFLESLAPCKEAQGELIDILLRQILLMIDSNARHDSIRTINNSESLLQFQLLLTNSITISQIVTDKIWHQQLYFENFNRVLAILDHQLCLAEQIFKFNELLPKQNPPHAFNMQRILNRCILFALSRPMQHMSDKIVMLDLLKKLYDNRIIIILNHMHCQHSAEFFVCFTYCLMRIIEDNTNQINPQTIGASHNPSLIERQLGQTTIARSSIDPSINGHSSSALMLVSIAKKIWDAIYQSKKGVLSEALDVSLSLPAFTLDTSLDLMQLKPDINNLCERFWLKYVEGEQKPRQRLPRHCEQPPSVGTSTAVHILSGRLTRVVNAANFVSRVVGATAGSMASNVNLVGEKLTQTRSTKRESFSKTNAEHSSFSPTTVSSQSQGCSMQSFSSANQDQLFKYPAMSKSQVEDAIQTHISIIVDYIETQLSQTNQKLALHKYLCDEWYDVEYEMLLRERALFGPDYGSKLDKWCLDLTEGPRRMRKKMVNNTKQFYENYPYRPEQYNPSNKSLRYRPPMSFDSYLYYMKTLNMHQHLLEPVEKSSPSKCAERSSLEDSSSRSPQPPVATPPSIDERVSRMDSGDDVPASPVINVENLPIDHSCESRSSVESLSSAINNQQRLNTTDRSSPRPSEGDPDDGDSTSFVDFSPEIEAEANSARESKSIDSLSVLRLLEKNERISHMFRCSRVQGLDTYEGLLLFGREHFYLIDGFTLLKTREIKDIDSLPPDAHDPIIPNSTPNILAHSKKTCAKFSFDSVIEVHKRRYLLQPIALEVFSLDGRNTLIAFPRNIRNKVYSRLMTVSTQLTSNAHESLAGQKSNVSVEGGSGLLSNLIGETSVTQRWVRGELSNFQYLMNLNTIAGRSYNDLMQYPIFPWILADYTSDYLDLSKPSTFRDLSRPVGAQSSERLEQFKRRYADWDDTETPPYHYGTFYSSAMIVASYMVRMEPFTQHFLRLQGGHFDLADRMFHSVGDSWLSASKHNMADIKELVPEFFYLPEFLKNENKYDLGIKQNGMKLDDVKLPPWAKGDTREFIRLHRCALECDYVSAHLHEWIDLIFGYKQQGQAAVDAVNVFHHLFYEGNVDIYNTDIDPIKKNAVIGFINNFGQVPKQLFKKPHPVRKVTLSGQSSTLNSMPLTPMLPSLSSNPFPGPAHRVLTYCPQALRPTNSNFKDLKGPVGQIVQIDKSVVAVEQNKLLIPPEYCRYIAWGHADRSLRLGLYDSERPIFVWEGSEFIAPCEVLCCTIPNNRTMVTAGTESLITVWKIERMKSFSPVLNLYGHVEPITCLASSQSYSLIVSGSRDRTAIIWDLNRFTFVRQLGGGPEDKLVHHGPVSAIAINDSTGDIATCASSWLYLWSINGELLASIDSFSVSVQQSVCGNSSMSSNLSQIHLLSVCFSQFNEWESNEVIITGASDGSVAIWSMRYYQSPLEEGQTGIDLPKEESLPNSSDQPIRSSVASEQREGNERIDQESASTTSEPINIERRRRTDTMNSDWVRLSASSTSTVDTIPTLGANLTHQESQALEVPSISNDAGINESFINNSFWNFNECENPSPPTCSTPVFSLAREPDGGQDVSSARSNQDNQPEVTTSKNMETNHSSSIEQSREKCNLILAPSDSSLKFSKSDNSLIESFVMLGDMTATERQSNSGLERVRPQSSTGVHRTKPSTRSVYNREQNSSKSSAKLLPEHCWKRELYLRRLLPRRSAKFPPFAVTSLAISKDHKTLFVGDASGRISNWSTS